MPSLVSFRLIAPPANSTRVTGHKAEHLGTKAVQCEQALRELAEAGSVPAGYALSRLHEAVKGRTNGQSLRELDNIGFPVDLHPQVRWKLDPSGKIALQLLLWLWYAERQRDQVEPPWRNIRSSPFCRHEAVVRLLWMLALDCLKTACPQLHAAPVLRSIKRPPSVKGDPVKENNYIASEVRHRFLSLLPTDTLPR